MDLYGVLRFKVVFVVDRNSSQNLVTRYELIESPVSGCNKKEIRQVITPPTVLCLPTQTILTTILNSHLLAGKSFRFWSRHLLTRSSVFGNRRSPRRLLFYSLNEEARSLAACERECFLLASCKLNNLGPKVLLIIPVSSIGFIKLKNLSTNKNNGNW